MIHSAIFLALVSVLLATIMFSAYAPWAGVFELSVCAGLITVLFASTASMIGRGESYAKRERKKFLFLPPVLIVFGVLVWLFGGQITQVFQISQTPAVPAFMTVGDVMWNLRLPDLLGQLCLFVAGVMAVRVILGEGSDE
jgi:NADH-quinone oxidoreductase subunit J